MLENKFSSFFHSIKDFTINAGLAEENCFEGENKYNLDVICKKYNITIDDCLYAYYENFGIKMEILNTYGLYFSIKNLEKAYDELNAYDFNLCTKLLAKDNTNIKNIKPFFLDYDEIGSVYTTLVQGKENSKLYCYWGGDLLTSEGINFIQHIRYCVFSAFIKLLKNKKKTEKTNSWIDFYAELPLAQMDEDSLYNIRTEFYDLFPDSLMLFFEYESKFVDWMKENNKLEALKFS
jgi:hypothetical protein